MNEVIAEAILIGLKDMPEVIDKVIREKNFITCIEEIEDRLPVNSYLPVKKKYGVIIDFTVKMPENETDFYNRTLHLYRMFSRLEYYNC